MGLVATTRQLRLRNRGIVLERIIRAGSTTRADLVTKTGLSAATVTSVVAGLLEEGLARESGQMRSDGGRPKTVLSIVPDSTHLIGIEVSEHGATAQLFDLGLTLVDSVSVTRPDTIVRPEELRTEIHEAVTDLVARNAGKAVFGVGLGLPGIITTAADGSVAVHAQALGWEAVAAEEITGNLGMRVILENGAKTFALAEQWHTSAAASGDVIAVLLGRGLGAGVLKDGEILRGATSSAAEWGHTKVSIDGPVCTCGARGCLEAHIGAEAVKARWHAAGGRPIRADENTLQVLVDAANEGDVGAEALVADVIAYLGVGLSTLINLYEPRRVIIGGWSGQIVAERLLKRVIDATRARTLNYFADTVEIVSSQFGADAVALGAAVLPLRELIAGVHLVESDQNPLSVA